MRRTIPGYLGIKCETLEDIRCTRSLRLLEGRCSYINSVYWIFRWVTVRYAHTFVTSSIHARLWCGAVFSLTSHSRKHLVGSSTSGYLHITHLLSREVFDHSALACAGGLESHSSFSGHRPVFDSRSRALPVISSRYLSLRYVSTSVESTRHPRTPEPATELHSTRYCWIFVAIPRCTLLMLLRHPPS